MLHIYETQSKKSQWWKVLVAITASLLLVAFIVRRSSMSISPISSESVKAQPSGSRAMDKISDKIQQDIQEDGISAKAKTVVYEIETASVTEYTAKESCLYPTKKGCLTASGTIATPGRTAACPKRFSFGTRFTVLGHHYICEDRTADWVQKRYGDTFDIFAADYQEALKFGRKRLTVVYEKENL